MYISIRDLASLATITLFLSTMFTWGEIIKFIA